MRAKDGLESGLVGWGGYQVASFPVVLGVYLAAVSRILEQSDGSHVLVGVSLTREGRNSCTIILYDKLRWRHSYGKKFFHKVCDSYFCTHEQGVVT